MNGGTHAEVSVVIVTDDVIQQLNAQWRGKDKPTDVLSWPLAEPGEPFGEQLGDVVISRDTAERQALARGWELEDELALLLVHGILHLLGHEDDTEEGSEKMKEVERRILGKPLDPLPTSPQPLT
jgi:probable rRNA maturation factor